MENFNKRHELLNEIINSVTHGIGALLSIAGLITLIVVASLHYDAWHIVSYSIYGSSLILLYTASTLYHSAMKEKIKNIFQKFDHSAIYVLIAGSYTPYTLITLQGTFGWILFGVVWAMAISGIVFQLFFYSDKYRAISAFIYIIMGWIAVIAIKPLIHSLPTAGALWLLFGGLSYTGGVVFYLWRKLPFNHGIWHLFVLGGSVCHFISIFLYV